MLCFFGFAFILIILNCGVADCIYYCLSLINNLFLNQGCHSQFRSGATYSPIHSQVDWKYSQLKLLPDFYYVAVNASK